jgi:N-acetylmuramoyl-L-alanine amidase
MVDIHHNTYTTDTTVDYGTALYYKASDKELAASILNATSSELNVKNDGIASFDDSELYIANMPATLSEAFFMTNNIEYDLISKSNPARLKTESDSIAKGINNYFSNPNQSDNTVDSSSLIIDRVDTQD